jgi:hypothetical protein
VKFSLDLSLGNVISLAMFLITLYTLHRTNTKRLDSMESKFDIVYEWFCRHIFKESEFDRDRRTKKNGTRD